MLQLTLVPAPSFLFSLGFCSSSLWFLHHHSSFLSVFAPDLCGSCSIFPLFSRLLLQVSLVPSLLILIQNILGSLILCIQRYNDRFVLRSAPYHHSQGHEKGVQRPPGNTEPPPTKTRIGTTGTGIGTRDSPNSPVAGREGEGCQ
jgi:hypothetical protein